MRRIDRLPLAVAAAQALDVLASQVSGSTDPDAEVAQLWRNLPRHARDSIQQTLREMSTGLERCMYCEDSQGTDIEHFWPKNRFPERAFSWLNYLLACSHCNSNGKRTAFPLDDQNRPLLLDPTSDTPSDHLLFSPDTGRFEGLDARGDATVKVCGLNRDVCAVGRLDAWIVMGALIAAYAQEMNSKNQVRANEILGALRRHPFQSVRLHLVSSYRRGDPLILPTEARRALAHFPELLD